MFTQRDINKKLSSYYSAWHLFRGDAQGSYLEILYSFKICRFSIYTEALDMWIKVTYDINVTHSLLS